MSNVCVCGGGGGGGDEDVCRVGNRSVRWRFDDRKHSIIP